MQRFCWLVIAAVFSTVSTSPAPAPLLAQSPLPSNASSQIPLHTSDSLFPHAELTNLSADGKWTFEIHAKLGNKAQQQTLDMASVVRWGAWSGVLQKSAVWLSDGSWLVGRIEYDSPQSVTVHSDWFQPAKIPLRAIRGFILIAPASLATWNQLQAQMESVSGGRDTLWLTGNRQISGILRVELDEIDKTPSYVLENAGQPLAVDSNEVRAIVFSPTLMGAIPAQSKQAVLGLSDGSRLNIRQINDEAAQVRVELASGQPLQSLDSRPEFCRGIVCVTNRPANTIFLSDLEPASYKHVPQSQLTWSLGRNRDVLGRPLMASAGIVDRGLAMHSSSQVAFRLDGTETRLLAEVQLAKPAAGANEMLGSAQCQVLVARSGKLQELANFPLDRNHTHPHLLNLDISRSQLLVLVTDQSDFAQYGDHVLWLDARILSKP